ncbi:hypothetical protein [Brevundimonas sp.]|uniref:hypothetical protein n=1 Tax=Brevundimonas sp. TaxID=1871086 RepID=UPI002BE35DEB|nr:hypothetical protein [Brevundimonas sp.]HWQ85534.1 hypothetical protein [Brevundimonas sp.]
MLTILTTICVTAGGLLLLTLVVTGFATDKVQRHPGGRAGMARDNLLMLAPGGALLAMLAIGQLTTVDDGPAWLWAWVGLVVGVLSWSALPFSRRARARLSAAHRYPPQ